MEIGLCSGREMVEVVAMTFRGSSREIFWLVARK